LIKRKSYRVSVLIGGDPMKRILQMIAVAIAVIVLLDGVMNSLRIKKLSKPYY